MIAQLLDEREAREGFRAGVFGERLRFMDPPSVFGQSSPFLLEQAIEPSVRLSGLKQAYRYSAAAEASRQPNFAAAKLKLLPPQKAEDSHLAELADLSTIMLANNIQRPLQQFYRNLAQRRMAATLLALRLYALDHDARLPETLTELVPKYLPSVPADPMVADGSPMSYKPHRSPPAIYSAASNAYMELKQIPPSSKAQDHHGQENVSEGQKPKDQ